jgi:hypothetical protein
MKEYEIWSEGFAATGESAKANFIGSIWGETFIDACKNSGLKLSSYDPPIYWGCRLFDNEADARKSFG